MQALKLAYRDVGEIDFICCSSILDGYSDRRDVRGQNVALEIPAEIIAKKVYFRGGYFQPRDMFDLAAVAECYGIDYIVEALRQCGKSRCATALATVEKARLDFVQSITGQLMYRDKNRHLIGTARGISRQVLELALA